MFNTKPWLYYSTTSNKLTNTYIQGILDICGNIVLRNGGFSLPNGDLSMNGNLYVGLDTTMIGNVNIQGNLVVNERVLQTLQNDPSYNTVNGYYALAKQTQPIVSKQTAYDIGQNWQNAVSGVLTNNWFTVCWSSELGLFCALSNVSQKLMLSSDGLNWTGATNDILGTWRALCWAPEIGKFCAVAESGFSNVMLSSNGFTWSGITTGIANQWRGVCWAPEIRKFCAVAITGTNRSMVSSNGTTWINTTSGLPSNTWYSVCWSPELNIFCAVSTTIAISSDGLTWRSAVSVPSPTDLTSVCWSSELGLFCAVSISGTRAMISSDGLYWTASISGVISNQWRSVCWAAELGIFCATAENGTTNQRVMISRDGLYWKNAANISSSLSLNSVCWSPELSTFCAVASSGTTNERVLITNQNYQLPTTKSLKTLLNDGNYNINIPSASSGTFPNFRTTATGPNLINIGNGNYKLVAAALRDSIAIGNTILNASNPNGYGMIGMGQNVFPVLTTGFQNIGIGNAIATSMTTGYNNVFIGNSVATSTTSTGNTVAIGTNAGRTNITGINNTYLGAFTNANAAGYNNSTALNYGATITSSNQIKLGTSSERVDISGNLNVSGLASFLGYFKPSIIGFNYIRTTPSVTGIASGTLIRVNNASYFNTAVFDSGHTANGFFTAPITGYYIFHCNIWTVANSGYNIVLNSSNSANGTVVGGAYTQSNPYGNTSTTIVRLNVNGNVKIYATGSGTPALSHVNNISSYLGFLLYAA